MRVILCSDSCGIELAEDQVTACPWIQHLVSIEEEQKDEIQLFVPGFVCNTAMLHIFCDFLAKSARERPLLTSIQRVCAMIWPGFVSPL